MEHQRTNWIQHLEFLALMVAILGGLYFFDTKLETKINILDSRIQSQIMAQSQRTDRLYEMFIDLLKDKKKND